MVTVLCGNRWTSITGAEPAGDDLWVPLGDLERASGWTLKPEGVCLEDTCVPIPPGREAEFLRPQAFNLPSLWRHLGKPVIQHDAGDIWLFGEAATDHYSALTPGEASAFTLPDLAGREHSLTEYKSSKVFLVSWASW